jgi:hypothetical protein
LLAKAAEGCSYFISQTVYQTQATEQLLRDYLRGLPRRRHPTSTDCPDFRACWAEKDDQLSQVARRPDPVRDWDCYLQRRKPDRPSIEICRDNLERFLDHDYVSEIPLGINVESVSINRNEIDASVDLFRALDDVMRAKFGDQRRS